MPFPSRKNFDVLEWRRAHKGATLVPQTATGHLFKVRGGAVEVLIQGRCTVAGTSTATNAKLTATPTTGSATDMCANVAITSVAAETLFTITGTLANAGVLTANGAVIGQASPVIVKPGYIDLITDASNAAAKFEWEVLYRARRPGARVVAYT